MKIVNHQCAVLRKKIFSFALWFLLLGTCAAAEAEQANKIPRIAFLSAASATASAARFEAFHRGLVDLGYADGKNVVIESRYANGQQNRLIAVAAELARLKVDVIVTGGPTATRAAKEQTSIIPVVMAFDDDPVGSGFVASLARPGGNITGLSTLAPEITAKQLELLKDVVPKLSRMAVFGTSTHPGTAQTLRELEFTAKSFAMAVQYLDILVSENIETSFREATKRHADAAIVLVSPIVLSHRARIASFAAKNRLPAIYPWAEFVAEGGLMAYGPSIADLYRRAATYVDKILKGSKPADLPVEQPTKFEMVINLKTAKQIGLTIPPNVLARADRVIR